MDYHRAPVNRATAARAIQSRGTKSQGSAKVTASLGYPTVGKSTSGQF